MKSSLYLLGLLLLISSCRTPEKLHDLAIKRGYVPEVDSTTTTDTTREQSILPMEQLYVDLLIECNEQGELLIRAQDSAGIQQQINDSLLSVIGERGSINKLIEFNNSTQATIKTQSKCEEAIKELTTKVVNTITLNIDLNKQIKNKDEFIADQQLEIGVLKAEIKELKKTTGKTKISEAMKWFSRSVFAVCLLVILLTLKQILPSWRSRSTTK